MINSYSHQEQLKAERLNLKSAEIQFINLVTEGTNCSRFESEAVSKVAKQVFALGEYEDSRSLQAGQMVYNATSDDEPAGKPLKECKTVRVILTLHDRAEDSEVEQKYSTTERRKQQMCRIAVEAKDQGGLLTQEDIAFILNSHSRTIRRDMAELRKLGISLPTRGQQKDIGPGVTHRQIAIRQFLEGKEILEIARNITHSIKAVERYVQTFCRVVYANQELSGDRLKTAMVVGISISATETYLDLYWDFKAKNRYSEMLTAIEDQGRRYWEALDFKKKPGQTKRRKK